MDPRKILGVSQDASLDEIHCAYREKVKKHHPDMGGDVWAFQQVNDAYEALTKTGHSNNCPTSKRTQTATDPKRRPSDARTGPENSASRTARAASPNPRSDSSRRSKRKGQPSKENPAKFSIFRHQLPLQTETSIFILVNVLDIFMTRVVLEIGGMEANPVAKFFLDLWGLSGLIWFKLFIVTFVCIIAQIVAVRRLNTARGLLIVGTLIVFCVVVYGVSLIAGKLG